MPQSIAHVLATFPLPSETYIAEEILLNFKKVIQASIFHMNEANRSKRHPYAQALLGKVKITFLITFPSTASNYDRIPCYGKTNENNTCLPLVLSVHWGQSNSCSAAF